MEEKDFTSYEYFLIETDEKGRRWMHIEGCCWRNGGRTAGGDDGEEEYDAPYSVTEYCGCYIPLGELIACRTSAERWDLICDYECACNQYEGDYTWEQLIDAGYGDPAGANGVMCTDGVPNFDNCLHYSEIWWNTPDGCYYYRY